VLRGPIVGLPRILDKEVFPSDWIGHSPACCAPATDDWPREEWLYVKKWVYHFNIARSAADQSPGDFAPVFNTPTNAGIEPDIGFVWGTHPEDQSHEGMRILVDVERRGVLSAAAVEMEKTKEVPSQKEHANKSAVWLVNE
jgi:hypothetical protein